MKLVKQIKLLVASAVLLGAASVNAAPIYMTGDLQNGVFFGSGNSNGSFTGINEGGIELGIRGKLRYNLLGLPSATYNYDGVDTYTFSTADGLVPASDGSRSLWNFDFSIDASGTVGGTLASSGYSFALGFDTDPTANVNFLGGPGGFDPALFGGEFDTVDPSLATTIQNSQNLGFGYTGNTDPLAAGVYTISLFATNLANQEVLSTSINIVVEAAEVSAPATLGLSALAIGLLGFSRIRSKS